MQAIARTVEIPFRAEYRSATQSDAVRRSLLLEVSDGGVAGWGEFPELPGYSAETVETALAAISGKPVTHSNPLAIAAARMALADLTARRENRALSKYLGAAPGPVEVGAVVATLGDTTATVEAVGRVIDQGFGKVKIKIGPGFDDEPLAAIRSVHPDALIAADANGSYPPNTDLGYLDGYRLEYLEQPYPASTPWEASAQLRAAMETRICLDEAITGPPGARSAIAVGACDLINLKPARLAGFETARLVHDLASEAGVGLVAGGLLETSVGRAHALAFARLPGFTEPADLAPPSQYLTNDLAAGAITQTDGIVQAPPGAGIGLVPDATMLDRYTIATQMLEVAAH